VGNFNPQASKEARALVEFAEGLRMGENPESGKWLANHGANQWGNKVDKDSLNNRIKWVEDNTDKIMESAKRPLDYDWWLDADEPWLFLAFCFEWADYKRDGVNVR
jgi:DNA-directed RNA polymerase